jgi:hypothetical protein
MLHRIPVTQQRFVTSTFTRQVRTQQRSKPQMDDLTRMSILHSRCDACGEYYNIPSQPQPHPHRQEREHIIRAKDIDMSSLTEDQWHTVMSHLHANDDPTGTFTVIPARALL